MSDGKMQTNISFYHIEVELWRLGFASYLNMIANTASNQLDAAGAIGPYEFFVERGDGAVTPYVFVGREL